MVVVVEGVRSGERGMSQQRGCRDTGGTSLSYGNASLNLIKAA